LLARANGERTIRAKRYYVACAGITFSLVKVLQGLWAVCHARVCSGRSLSAAHVQQFEARTVSRDISSWIFLRSYIIT
jgi:hypothetical protein